MMRYILLMGGLSCLLCLCAMTSDPPARSGRVVFYNVENLFDPFDDSLSLDQEFTPEGDKHWTYYRYQNKLRKTFKIISALGELDPPVIIGLCEVENSRVLNDLVQKTPLQKFNYRVIHKESPDRRGIDVALLYRPDSFKPIYYEPVPVVFPWDKHKKTRDILHVKGQLWGDTIHFFINHWPSRYGGQKASQPGRIQAAKTLKTRTDSIYSINSEAKMIIMGDLNDNPDDTSILTLCPKESDPYLINLMTGQYEKGNGTLVFNQAFGQWHLFDQLIISASLLKNEPGLALQPSEDRIFKPAWLLDPVKGVPLRTYQGPLYLGGFSDHLPVYLDLISH
ncbi:MAG: endonuclease/exonuclease/phosphatase family protein [Candidatus Cyclobacteriaceae bacterium M3_2C_046]